MRTGRFRASDRLLRSREFQRVARCGGRAAAAPYVVLVAYGGDASRPPRLGVTASRKVGKAVARNRVKRRVREWFRGARQDVPVGCDVVVIARAESVALPWGETRACLERLTAQACGALGARP